MNVILFFTYDVSLKDWFDKGLLDRELKIYENISKNYNIKFTFVTYGTSEDLKYISKDSDFKVLPIYEYLKKPKSKFFRLIKSLYIPFYIKKITKNDYQIIKTNQLYGGWVAIIYKFISKNPLLVRTGYDLLSFSIYENKNIFKKLAYYILTLVSLNLSDYYVVTSKTDYKFLTKYFFFNENKLRLIPNWVDVPNSKQKQKRILRKVLVVGRLEKQKNIELLIKNFQNSKFQIDIFGEGSLEKDLKNISKNSKNISFKGVVDHKELLKLYEVYSFYVSMSSYEGNPKSTLEAMGLGCIVAVNDIPNNNELITNFENGIIFNPIKENVVEILEKLETNTKLMNNIRESGINYIKTNNSIKEIVKKEIEIYNLINISYNS